MNLVLFLLAAFGVIYVVVDSAIFAPVRVVIASRSRFFGTLLYCAYCTGFWVGLLLTPVFVAWTWDDWWFGRLALLELVGGTVVMGAVAFIRGWAPHFLSGAYEREREIVKALRDGRQAEPERGSLESVDGDAGSLQ